MRSLKQRKQEAGFFIQHLEGMRRTPGRLAELRRCATVPDPQDSVHVHKFVVPHLPVGRWPDEERAYYLIASLWTLRDTRYAPGVTLAKALAAKIAENPSGAPGIERRFNNTIDAHYDDVLPHLRGLITLTDGSIDWVRLLLDLSSWSKDNKPVQHRWARDFWSRSNNRQAATATAET